MFPLHLPALSSDGTRLLLAVLLLMLGFNMCVAAVAMLWPAGKPAPRCLRRFHVLSPLILPRNPRQRTFLLRHLVGLSNCLAGLAALNYGVLAGVIDPVGCTWLSLIAVAVVLVISVMLRTGLNQRFSDPSLVTAHIYFAEFFLAWGYYLGGPCRPVALVLLFVVLLANFFTHTGQVVRRTSIAAIVCFGVVMARVAWEERDLHNGPEIQGVYFAVLLMVLASLYLLVNNLHRVRATSARRKQELVKAMALIQELATRDELTGLFNRRHMLSLLQTETARSERAGHPLCLALLDVDHFKRINDLHGHGVGDQVLCAVAEHLTEGMRDIDAVARWGGEEFLVMLPETDCHTAERVLRRLLGTLSTKVLLPGQADLRVSFSGGVSQLLAGETHQAALERADRALYQAKAEGRGRLVRADDPGCRDQVA